MIFEETRRIEMKALYILLTLAAGGMAG